MTKQLAVLLALKALVQTALPAAEVRGFDGDTSKPKRVEGGGTVIGHPGDPGAPEIDLSPLSYNYEHRIVLEIAAEGLVPGAPLDAMLETIGVAIRADRTLGGLCTYLAALAPDRNDRTSETGGTSNWAAVPIVASYSTEDPLA